MRETRPRDRRPVAPSGARVASPATDELQDTQQREIMQGRRSARTPGRVGGVGVGVGIWRAVAVQPCCLSPSLHRDVKTTFLVSMTKRLVILGDSWKGHLVSDDGRTVVVVYKGRRIHLRLKV